MIEIKQIHNVQWANSEQTMVLLVADTATGQREQISTPYSEESIIWQAVQEYPHDQIQPYESVVQANPTRYISIGAFYDRFGELKWPILASQDPMVQALIKDTSVRKYINLDSAQISSGLDLLITAGFAIDKIAILQAPIEPDELP